jgi:hypothetical protein
MRPENLEMNMFLNYNLRALNYSVENLQPVPKTFRCPNSQKRDPTTQEIQTRDQMMTVPTAKTVILIFERI